MGLVVTGPVAGQGVRRYRRKMSDVIRATDFEGDNADADARLAAIVDSSFDAIIGKDLNSVITSWNRAAERLFGYTAHEAIGQSVLMLIPDSLRGEEDDIIARIRRGESVPPFQTIRRRKDGGVISVSLTISPIRNRAGQIVGASKIARDITDAKAAERRIRFLLREVNHRVKNQFAVILSMVRETAKHTLDPKEFERSIRDRIMSLASSHDLLVSSEWSGAGLRALAEQQLKHFGQAGQISIDGPEVILRPTAVQALGMAFHELGTNSAKYGAFGHRGAVSVSWTISGEGEDRMFRLVWEEAASSLSGIPPDGSKARGFGTVVLLRVAPQTLSGTAQYDRSPGILRWTLVAPIASVMAEKGAGEAGIDGI
jgi:PAS domain S-box-containing protein